MKEPITPGKTQWPMTILLLFEGVVLGLWGLHIISKGWTRLAFFVVIIPFATLKAFTDFRRT